MTTLDLTAVKDSLVAFGRMIGKPLKDWQAAALALLCRVTVIVAPRQSGKSWTLAVLALWWAYRRPGQRVLIVSAGEEASKRLLAEVRAVATGSALLRGSVVDETAGLLTLSNGSEIRSVPASERQIRGWTVDLLLVDEAALVGDDLLLGAAMPTTAARPDARIVLASSPLTAAGAFFDHASRGEQGDDEHVRTFRWRLVDADWISPTVIAAARASMSELRFRCEYEAEFVSAADALFPRALLDRATADFLTPGLEGLRGVGLLGGVDWGQTTDRSALVAMGRLPAEGVVLGVACAHAWRPGHRLVGPGGVIEAVAGLPVAWARLTAEANGLGGPCAAELARLVGARSTLRSRVEVLHTSSEMKAASYSALRMGLDGGGLVLPASATDLRRELLLLRVEMLAGGTERIEARTGHDDLADALMLAAGPYQDGEGRWRTRLGDLCEPGRVLPEAPPVPVGGSDDDWTMTGGGLRLPRLPGFGSVASPALAMTMQRRPGFPDPTDPVIVGADGWRLAGERFMDRSESGELVPPPGWRRAA